MRAPGLASHALFRFLLVGSAMAVIYAVLAALATSYLPWPKAVSAAAAWLACIPLGYTLHRRISFVDGTPRRHAPWIYAGSQALSIGIAAAVSALFARGSFWPDLVVHFSGSALAAMASYALNRTLTFPRDRASNRT